MRTVDVIRHLSCLVVAAQVPCALAGTSLLHVCCLGESLCASATSSPPARSCALSG